MKLKIDSREFQVNEGQSVLDAAECHGVYIPHLCSHPQLTSYGGCRLCIVEIEGIRGYPTACTTKVKDGMVIHTETEIVREMRKEILQLILSEHPSGCLVCDESDECGSVQHSIRKVGAATGCRWCAKDAECELQRVVKFLGIDDIKFPVYYQDLEVEKYDPFFDRDYNLCIYCGRCIRICGEFRKSFVLALNERGKDAFVGAAFHHSHVEADCEFCGACVSVCPTGALAEKSKKWAGLPERYAPSLCPFCSLNCEIQIPVKNRRIIGALPPGDPHLSGGELCVKGRFCLNETVNYPDRVLEASFRFPQGYGIIAVEDAYKKAAEQFGTIKGKRAAFYISPNLPLEEAAAAWKFAHEIVGTEYISCSVVNANMAAFLEVADKSVPLQEIEDSDVIVSILMKGNTNYAPVTLGMKRAAEKGAYLCRIGWTSDNTDRFAALNMCPTPAKEKFFFRKMGQVMEKGKGGSADLKELIKKIKAANKVTFVLGHEIADLTDGKEIVEIIEEMAQLIGAGIFAPNPFGNIRGLLAVASLMCSEEMEKHISEGHIDLLYIVGDSPFTMRPPVDFILHQSSFPPPEAMQADLLLPAATWGEISGSYEKEGTVRKFTAAVEPPGSARSNVHIFAGIASAMGKNSCGFTNQVLAEAFPSKLKIDFPHLNCKRIKKKKVLLPDPFFPYLLIQERTPHAFHNLSLSSIIPGLAEILPEETLVMNPEDAAKLGLCGCSSVEVESAEITRTYPLKLQDIIASGYIFLLSHAAPNVFETNPCPVHLRRKDV
ncbi:MAG: molybdopterin-dependent oxidoreductase [bacterium]|nr:molybdopterin-dependent oxidoreductase [bacterium]